MRCLRTISLLLVTVFLCGMLTGCRTEAETVQNPVSESISQITVSEEFKEALDAGIAWEALAAKSGEPITAADLVSLMENGLSSLEKADADGHLLSFSKQTRGKREIRRYELAQLLYGIHQDVIGDHNFALSATAIHYEVGGTYRQFEIWDCPDIMEIDRVCSDAAACNYAICAFDRRTGEKLMKLYEDWTFRPAEAVTVKDAVETVLRFVRSFEKAPFYVDVHDEKAAKHTIDSALYTGETSLPDASNRDLPDWRGCNISFNSMFAGGLCFNPDDSFVEGNLDYFKDLGVNFVHVYLSWSYFQGPDHTFDNKVNLSRLEQLDEIISWCMERDIHIQLVFNDVPNLDWNNLGQKNDWEDWWNACFVDETVRDAVTAFWRMLAKRYADIPNNYLSFNLMNECDPVDDAQYVWGFGDAVAAIRQATPDRVIVADVHTSNPAVTGTGMAELGCALSYHFYNLRDISIVSAEKEAETPGFYERIQGTPYFVNAHFYGPDYWDGELPEEAKGNLKLTGAVGGATLSVTVEEISWFDTAMRITADGQVLYEGMEPCTYEEATDCIHVNRTVTVSIPEQAETVEIGCPVGSCFTVSDLSLTLQDGTACGLIPLKDGWGGTPMTSIAVDENGVCVGTLGLEYVKQNGASLLDLMAVGERYGVDVMVGECGFFEGGDPMTVGIGQAAVEALFADQIETFDRLDLAWCFEYLGRYALATPAPYLEGIAYRDLENSPYYVNLEMDAFFRQILAQ